jgi:hypothetical protein
LDTTGLETTGADYHFSGLAVGESADALKIGVEASFGYVMGMADIAADHRFFSANFTHFGHVAPSSANANRSSLVAS